MNQDIKKKIDLMKKEALDNALALDQALDTAEGLEVGEREETTEGLDIATAYDNSDVAASWFLFFSNMFNKLGTTNVADSEIDAVEKVDVKSPENKETNTEEVCEAYSGRWSIYEYAVKVFDTSIDIDDAKRCNKQNISQTFFEYANMLYKKSELALQPIFGTIGGACWGIIKLTYGAAGAILGTLAAICTLGAASPKAALLLIHYTFLYTFKNELKKNLLDNSVGRDTNFVYKTIYSFWYHSFKSLTKIYTQPGTLQPDYPQMCTGLTCLGLTAAGFTAGLNIPITYASIENEADGLMQLMYDDISQGTTGIDIRKYNVYGDIDIGQKTGEANTSSLKDLIIKLSNTSFMSQSMMTKYNLLVQKNTNNNLDCGDIQYNIENYRIAVYSYMNSLIDPTKKEFFSDFMMCAFIGQKNFEIKKIHKILWHMIKNPGIYINVFKDSIIFLVANKDIRPFLLTFLLGKETQGANINFIRDIIDSEIKYLEGISINTSGDFDLAIFEQKLESDIFWHIPNFIRLYNGLVWKIYNAFKGNNQQQNNNQKTPIPNWILYDDFLTCVKGGCNELKKKASNIIGEMQTNILDVPGNNFINIIDLNNIDDDKYILSEINKQITNITINPSSFIYKTGISQEQGDDYLNKYLDVLNKYKTYVELQIELEKFVHTRTDSANNPFMNFPLQNFLFANVQQAVYTGDLINVCEPSQVLVHTGNDYSCKNIEISPGLKLDIVKYSDMIINKTKLIHDEVYKFVDDIMIVDFDIDELCNQLKLCSEDEKEEIEKFIEKSEKRVFSFKNDPENAFTKLTEILTDYKKDAHKILLSFKKKLENQISDNEKLLLQRAIELKDDANTPQKKQTLQSSIDYIENENKLLKSNLVIVNKNNVVVDSIKPPNDINKIIDFKSYLYNTLLTSIDVDKEPNFYAYVYLSKFDFSDPYNIKTEDLVTIYDAFSEENLELGKLILSDSTEMKFTDSKLNEKLNNKDVKKYITDFVGDYILQQRSKATKKFIKTRDNKLYIKEKGKLLTTEVKSDVELISALSGKTITDITPFKILFEHGYFLDKNKGEKSSLTLSKTWPILHTDLGDHQDLMENYVFTNFGENNEAFFKYNKNSSFNDANKFDHCVPPILHGLKINTITNTDVKSFIEKNYKRVGNIWIFKPDLQLYSNTFKGFDEKQFEFSIEQTILMKNELKLKYLKAQLTAKNEIDKLEAEQAAAKTALKKAIATEKLTTKEREAEAARLIEEEEKERLAAEAEKKRLAEEAAQKAKQKAQDEADEKARWENLSYFRRALEKGKQVLSTTATAVAETTTAVVEKTVEKTVETGSLIVRSGNLAVDVLTGKENLANAAKRVRNKVNYLRSTSLNENQLKYFDSYVGVQFEYFNELDVNVKNPFGFNKFSDYNKKYEYGTYELYNAYYGYSEYLPIESIERINFISVFNDVFSPSIFSKPFSNAYYDDTDNSQQLLYNSQGLKEII